MKTNLIKQYIQCWIEMATNFAGVKGDNFKGTCCATLSKQLTSGTGVKSDLKPIKEKIDFSKLQRLGLRLTISL